MKIFTKKKNISTAGFTLIETIVYMGILMILIGVMSSIFGDIVNVQLASKATSSVDQDGRYLLAKLLYDSKEASPSAGLVVNAPLGSPGTTLQLTINSINYTYSLDSNNNLQVVNDTTNAVDQLNSYDTAISNLTFTRIGNGGSYDNVLVSFTITSRTKVGATQETRTFETALGPE